MLDYIHQLNGFEFTNLTLLVGVLVATNLRRITNINPGGIVAGAFLILAASSSIWWALSLPLASIAIALIYKRFFSHIYVGRQPMFIMAGLSVILMSIIGIVLQYAGLLPSNDASLPLGLILPAILAATIHKQGVSQTMMYTGLSVLITSLLLAIIYGVSTSMGYDFHTLDELIAKRESLYLGWGALLSFVSVIIGLVIYKFSNVKSAGYIVLPLLATLLLVSPLNFLLLTALAVLIYGISAVAKRFSLLVGVGRYSFILTVAIVLVWTAEYVILHHTQHFSPFMGTSVFAALAIAVIVNEHNAYGVRKAAPMLMLSLLIMSVIELGGVFTIGVSRHRATDLHSLAVRQQLVADDDGK